METLFTAEDCLQLPDDGPLELVRGRIVRGKFRGCRHGQVCSSISFLLGNHVAQHNLGHTLCGSGVITQRDPDTVRGPDISYYSHQRLPVAPEGYASCAPEIIFEVLDCDETLESLREKAAEYLQAGVLRVFVVDPRNELITRFSADESATTYVTGDELTVSELLPGWRVPVNRFFR